jgi:hypothetical protein
MGRLCDMMKQTGNAVRGETRQWHRVAAVRRDEGGMSYAKVGKERSDK